MTQSVCGPGGASIEIALPRVSTPAPRRAHDRLPDGIWRTIFLSCLDHTRAHTRNRAPVVFLRVCHRWRDVARGVPELWSTIYPSFAHPKLISLFLELSANRPLSLYCGPVLSCADPGLGKRTRDTFEAFLLEVHRWKHVTFDLGETQAKRLATRLTTGSAPMLTLLSLDLDQVPHRLLSPLGKAIALACPNLKSLTLANPDGDHYPFEDFPLHRVQHASMTGPLVEEDAVRFISLCRRAEAIYMNAFGTRTLFQPPSSPVPQPALKRLHLITHGDPVPILKSFSLPNLKELNVEVNRPNIKNRECLLDYFEAAEFKLSWLSLRDAGQQDPIMGKIYRAPAVNFAASLSNEPDPSKMPPVVPFRYVVDF
jgi:hypothetical protein